MFRLSLFFLLCALLVASSPLDSSAGAAGFTNPIRKVDGSDPFIVWHDGYYYFLSTTWTDARVSRATTIEGLKNPETKVVYKSTSRDRCCNVWAPEIHSIDGQWYLYLTAGRDGTTDLQRTYVLRGGTSPWDNYTFLGRVLNDWAIDSTVATIADKRYLIYSCMSVVQSLCIAPLLTPATIGAVSVISKPTLPWETVGAAVNEGAAVISHSVGGNNTTFLTYSASYCWTSSYSLGLLTLAEGADPLQMRSWKKSGPVMRTANGNYAPGHNGFFKSPDGTQDWNVFHATSNREGTCDGNRYTMVSPVAWAADGSPSLGNPLALSRTLTSPSGEK
ncbi:glycoside hydrolase family 43 protein [Aulographum hederae CBS 113979]|uniref:Glycoside hydrolase family 43 protein n=1 Tax=Aulographum hederae CBS 113979 TaxID=1176131 RepID=A0A6G1GQF3_9PEZI|nr:glycoside hydrolase family 43 protein [Aulographum hederae CBS 113979]